MMGPPFRPGPHRHPRQKRWSHRPRTAPQRKKQRRPHEGGWANQGRETRATKSNAERNRAGSRRRRAIAASKTHGGQGRRAAPERGPNDPRPGPRTAPGSEAPRKASNTRPGMRDDGKRKAPKRAVHGLEAMRKKLRQRPTLPQRHRCSTIGSEELNFRVRDGIGWNLFDITTGKLWIASQPEFRDRALPPRETRRRAVELHQYCL